jgi:hypothetical protein
MKQVRHGVFETNSSSTHSITICTEDLYNKFNYGHAYYDRCEGEIVDASKLSEENLNPDEDGFKRYLTEEEFYSKVDGDTATKHFQDSDGTKKVAFAFEMSYH